ncbi:hypothetical protein LEP1GSC062_2261 [Leptospira alexanderi serovar Manhao 3 str. L 60]|uniref:Uncharacterized protein n=1 Tax=Leptospira alexanderi serovar Manhao 3 str. L 60 TaxID=1049759 RepID=V6IGB3_9LEPT|nr:hypothetical protein LEP1GSC062_2261 [Leptospira alexanderi serovar Manhao 3 str. L 60]
MILFAMYLRQDRKLLIYDLNTRKKLSQKYLRMIGIGILSKDKVFLG